MSTAVTEKLPQDAIATSHGVSLFDPSEVTAIINKVASTPFKMLVSRKLRKGAHHVAETATDLAHMVVTEHAGELFTEMHTWLSKATNSTVVANSVYYPRSWFQHLKHALYGTRVLPMWLRKKFPVLMHRERVMFEQEIRMCPHVMFPEGSHKHGEFIYRIPEITAEMAGMLRAFVHKTESDGYCGFCGESAAPRVELPTRSGEVSRHVTEVGFPTGCHAQFEAVEHDADCVYHRIVEFLDHNHGVLAQTR